MNASMTFLPVCALAMLTACGGGTAPEENSAQRAADGTVPAPVMRDRIRAMEDSLWAQPHLDRRGAMALQSVYLAFVKVYPTDTIAPEFIFRAAGTAKALGNAEESVQLYDRIIREYPDWSRLVAAYYMKAFTIDDGLKEKGRAQQAYEMVIAQFPGHPYAEQSKAMIENLRYSDEELIERFKRMNEGTEAASGKP